MTTTIEYALLAGEAYFSTRSAINRFPVPEGWTEDTNQRRADDQTGFEARTFKKGSEIVISFAGTDPISPADIITDLVNIAALGTMLGMPQYNSLELFYVGLVSTGTVNDTQDLIWCDGWCDVFGFATSISANKECYTCVA